MSDQWHDTFRILKRSFESAAEKSQGLHHAYVQINRGNPNRPKPEPAGFEMPSFINMDGTKSLLETKWDVLSSSSLPSLDPHPEPLTEQQSSIAPPVSEHDDYVRDSSGKAWAIWRFSSVRHGFLCGDRTSLSQFQNLSQMAGRLLRSIPESIRKQLPKDLQECVTQKHSVVRRYRFGQIDREPATDMSHGWSAGIMQLKHGVVIDNPESGKDEADGAWLLLLHQLGRRTPSGAMLRSSTWTWFQNMTFAFDPLHPEQLSNFISTFNPVPPVDINRYFSVIGEGKNNPIDVCFASIWAIDELIRICESISSPSSSPPTVINVPKATRAKARKLRTPSNEAFAAYRLSLATGRPQAEIADMLSREFRRPFKQNQVSRMLKQAERWIKSGNVLPEIPKAQRAARAIDPSRLEVGKRTDRITQRQRERESGED